MPVNSKPSWQLLQFILFSKHKRNTNTDIVSYVILEIYYNAAHLQSQAAVGESLESKGSKPA